MTEAQCTDTILMVSPGHFQWNQEAAEDNAYMHAEAEEARGDAVREFDRFASALQLAGVRVLRHQDSSSTPDACFPNNWFSTHRFACPAMHGTTHAVVLYPMKVANRQLERENQSILKVLAEYPDSTRRIDLSPFESSQRYLEGTGSLVLDRVNGIAFCCLSERSHREVAEKWSSEMPEYRMVYFRAMDRGKPIYHTNVVMAVGTLFAVVCLESIEDSAERKAVSDALQWTDSECTAQRCVVEISLEQLNRFCGNVLEVQLPEGKRALVCSTTAFNAFSEEQRERLLRSGGIDRFIAVDISTIERVGGGSARCMMAEMFL